MKNTRFRKLNVVAAAALSICFSFASCTKTNNNYVINPPIAYVTFTQAIPDAPLMDLYIDNIKFNSAALPYGAYASYFNIKTGTRNFSFYNTGTITTILSDTATFNTGGYYSVFLANKISKPQLVVYTDTLNKPAAGKAMIRFINLSPDAPNADLTTQAGAIVVPNKVFKGFSSFLSIKGDSTYTFQVRQAGTSTVLATLSNVKVNSTFDYTIWFHGLAAPTTTTNGLAVDISTNAYFTN